MAGQHAGVVVDLHRQFACRCQDQGARLVGRASTALPVPGREDGRSPAGTRRFCWFLFRPGRRRPAVQRNRQVCAWIGVQYSKPASRTPSQDGAWENGKLSNRVFVRCFSLMAGKHTEIPCLQPLRA